MVKAPGCRLERLLFYFFVPCRLDSCNQSTQFQPEVFELVQAWATKNTILSVQNISQSLHCTTLHRAIALQMMQLCVTKIPDSHGINSVPAPFALVCHKSWQSSHLASSVQTFIPWFTDLRSSCQHQVANLSEVLRSWKSGDKTYKPTLAVGQNHLYNTSCSEVCPFAAVPVQAAKSVF